MYGMSIIAAHFVEVREKFFLERIGKIRLRHHTETLWGKLKNAFNYDLGSLVSEYEKSNGYAAKKKKK